MDVAAGRVKSDQGHEVPLSDAAVDDPGAVPRIGDSPFVLTTRRQAPSSGYSKGKRKLDALLPPDMPAWRLHDLRGTASGMARLGINCRSSRRCSTIAAAASLASYRCYQRHDLPTRSAPRSTPGASMLREWSVANRRRSSNYTLKRDGSEPL